MQNSFLSSASFSLSSRTAVLVVAWFRVALPPALDFDTKFLVKLILLHFLGLRQKSDDHKCFYKRIPSQLFLSFIFSRIFFPACTAPLLILRLILLFSSVFWPSLTLSCGKLDQEPTSGTVFRLYCPLLTFSIVCRM